MRRKVTVLLLLIPFCCAASGDFAQLKGEHFIIQYPSSESTFAKEVLSHAEKYYRIIADELGYARHSGFWLWDKRVTIHIYPDHASYLKATGARSWSHGMADYSRKAIMGYAGSGDFTASVLPHEITHLLFRDFVGFKGAVPLWVDEGVAQWFEKRKRARVKDAMKQAYRMKHFLPLHDMMTLDISSVRSDEKMQVRYVPEEGKPVTLMMDGAQFINLYYLEAMSLVGFLIETHGGKKFTVFCRKLREGGTVEGALKAAYPYTLRSIIELDRAWRAYLETL